MLGQLLLDVHKVRQGPPAQLGRWWEGGSGRSAAARASARNAAAVSLESFAWTSSFRATHPPFPEVSVPAWSRPALLRFFFLPVLLDPDHRSPIPITLGLLAPPSDRLARRTGDRLRGESPTFKTKEQCLHVLPIPGTPRSAKKARLIRAMATVQGTELLDVIVDGGESAKSMKRPGASNGSWRW